MTHLTMIDMSRTADQFLVWLDHLKTTKASDGISQKCFFQNVIAAWTWFIDDAPE